MISRWILLTLLLYTHPAFAEFDRCSAYVMQNPAQKQALGFLQQLAGRYTIGKCELEIHVCDNVSATDDQGSIVGDVLVTNEHGAQQYVPVYFEKAASQQTTLKIENGKVMFHYELDDQHTRLLTGQKESVRFEIVKESSSKHAIRVETGTHDGLEAGSHSVHYYTWTICQGPLIPQK